MLDVAVTAITYGKRLKNVSFVWMLMAALMSVSCSKDDDPQPGDDSSVPKIILDMDVVSSTDDLFALQMAYQYDKNKQCKVLGVIVDRVGDANAASVDVMNTYYGYGSIPMGLVRKGLANPKVWIDYTDLPNYADEHGNKYFSRTYTDYSELPDGWQLYRMLLSGAEDKSVSICSLGFLPCLAQLLESGADEYSPLNGVDLVRQKVKCIYMMGGVFGESMEPDFNFAQGMAFSRVFFDKWPNDVDVILSPGEVGDQILYKNEQIISDISWTDAHPLKQIYLRCDIDSTQKMWDALTVIHAVEGDGLFRMSKRGHVTLKDNAETVFTESPTGNYRYEQPGDNAWSDMMLQKIRRSVVAFR